MKTLVEHMLPAEALLKQGLYVQTCAQIELTIWEIIKVLRGYDHRDPKVFDDYLRLKLRTRTMLQELRRGASEVPPRFGIEVHYLANRVHAGLENRNLAAHGAFRLDERTGRLRAEHYFTRGKGKNAEFYHVTGSFHMRGIDQAVEDADRILRDAVDLLRRLEEYRIRGMPLKNQAEAYLNGYRERGSRGLAP